MPFRPSPLVFARTVCCAIALASTAFGQGINNGKGKVAERFAALCANCHGKNLEGAQGPSLLKNTWLHGGDDDSIARSIRTGFPEKGMPPWGAALPEREVRAMVIFIHEMRAANERGQIKFTRPVESLVATSQLHSFQIHTWIPDVANPWSLTFLPDGSALFTERRGKLWVVEPGSTKPHEISG